MTAAPLKTFIIYARADAAYKDELLTHLDMFVRNQLIEKWVDSDLLPGEDWEKRIERELDAAHLVLMLVSADALSSEFIRKKELKTALDKKRAGNARIVPILVRDCFWEMHPDLPELQLLPKDENGKIRGVASWLSRDSAWTSCCRELMKLIQEIRSSLEKEVAEQARLAAEEAEKHRALAEREKAERSRHRRDEAFWKKVLADATATDELPHKITLYESYLHDPDCLGHRAEAEEAMEEIQAELDASERLRAAQEAARRKREEAERQKREAEEAEKKRREEEEAKAAALAAEARRAKEAAAKAKAAKEAAEQKRREEEAAAKAAALAAEARRAKEAAAKAKAAKEAARKKGLPDMVFVKGGIFQMGEKGVAEPVHSVTLSDFEIGKYPVTQKLWREIMGTSPSYFKGCDDCPVEQVSWDDAQDFLKKLNEKYPDKKYRLPTEAEWEYAARGGSLSKGYAFSGSNDLGEVGWYADNAGGKTHPVGQKKANELGLCDMSGNVWEWCADWYEKYPTAAQTNPTGPEKGSRRVYRGGSWGGGAGYCRVSYRYSWGPGNRYYYLGFRVASFPQ